MLVVEHEDDAPAAFLGAWLVEAGAELDVRRPYLGEVLPPDASGHDAVLVLGGEMGATSDEVAWIPVTRALVAAAAEQGVPVLGICLGHQLCAVALGGTVVRNPRGQQLGVSAVGWAPEVDGDPLLGAVAGATIAVHWNDDVVETLPDGARVLARAPGGEVQAARLAPSVWGVQAHPEVDEHVVGHWAAGAREVHGDAAVDAALIRIAEQRETLHAQWRPLAAALVALASASRPARPGDAGGGPDVP